METLASLNPHASVLSGRSNSFFPKRNLGQVSRQRQFSFRTFKTQATVFSQDPEPLTEQFLDVFQSDSRPVILFDGVCNFCNAGINMVLSLDSKEAFRFAALQSKVGKELLKRCNRAEDDISSMVVVEKDAFYTKSEAALKIGERLRLPFPFLSTLLWPLPKEIRDRGYDWIAENRYKIFGMRDECRLTDEREARRFLS